MSVQLYEIHQRGKYERHVATVENLSEVRERLSKIKSNNRKYYDIDEYSAPAEGWDYEYVATWTGNEINCHGTGPLPHK